MISLMMNLIIYLEYHIRKNIILWNEVYHNTHFLAISLYNTIRINIYNTACMLFCILISISQYWKWYDVLIMNVDTFMKSYNTIQSSSLIMSVYDTKNDNFLRI